MTMRRAMFPLVLLLLVPTALAGCGDDGGDDGDATSTTTEADPGDDDDATTTEPGDDGTTDTDGSTTEAPEATPTSEGGSTTSPNLPPNDSPLGELLLDPAVVGSGFTPDDSLGDGSFDTDLCEEVTLEQEWEDQAAQALIAGTGVEAVAFQQSVLRFPDEATAGSFVATVGDALVTCQPGTETAPAEGVGDEALLATTGDEVTTATAGLVRVGDLVTWLLVIGPPDTDTVLDEALLTTAADDLAA